jgi:hypothetical protein
MRYIILLLLSFQGIPLAAQTPPGLQDVVVDSAAYLPVQHYQAAGPSYRSTRDQALSPLLFQGPGVTFSNTSWKYKSQWLWQSSFGAEGHLLRNVPGSSLLSSMGLGYQLTALRELKELQQDNWRFWLGPEASMFGNLRMHSNNTNNIASYDWATTLGVSGMVSKKFSFWKRTFAISNQLKLPLLYLYARPPFAWGIPPAIYEEQEGAWKEAFQFGTLNDIISIKNQLNLDFYLRRKKKGKLLKYTAYRLAYSWSYFQVSTRNPLQTGGHELTLSRIITF